MMLILTTYCLRCFVWKPELRLVGENKAHTSRDKDMERHREVDIRQGRQAVTETRRQEETG
jgi:hypothetical protein